MSLVTLQCLEVTQRKEKQLISYANEAGAYLEYGVLEAKETKYMKIEMVILLILLQN